jgi:hypothetical protein
MEKLYLKSIWNSRKRSQVFRLNLIKLSLWKDHHAGHPFSTNKPDVVVHNWNHSYLKCIGRRITVQGQSQAKGVMFYVKNNVKQKGMEVWLMWQISEFKPQYDQRKCKIQVWVMFLKISNPPTLLVRYLKWLIHCREI